MASPPPVELSPGPLRMSDLDPSTPTTPLTTGDLHKPPRKLEPISSGGKKKRTRKRRTKRAAQEEDGQKEGDSLKEGAELIGESALSQLRARLDPIYNPPPAPSLDVRESSNNEPIEQTGSGRDREGEGGIVTPQEISETGDPHHSHKLSKHKRTRRGRKREEEEERKESEEPLPAPTCIQEGEPQEGMDHGKVDEPHPPPSEPPPQGSLRHGRQLPVFPTDDGDPLPEGATTSGPSLADQLALSGGQVQNLPVRSEYSQPDDPQFLVSEEDIEEDVDGPATRLHPSSHPHTHPTTTSHSKSVIFVERRDGRGFIKQGRGGSAGVEGGDVEGAMAGGEMEVSSAEFALYTHRAIETVTFSAHGLAAGISLWDCIVSNSLSRQRNQHLDLLQYYHFLTLPVHAVYIFLLSLVIVSLLDRFDFARLDRHCLESFIRAPSQILLFVASLLIFLALMVTLSVVALDERMALYPLQPSLWSDVLIPINTTSQSIPSPTTHSVGVLVYIPGNNLISPLLSSWLALTIVRAICCCTSWLLLVWVRDHDRLQDYLFKMAGNTHSMSRQTIRT